MSKYFLLVITLALVIISVSGIRRSVIQPKHNVHQSQPQQYVMNILRRRYKANSEQGVVKKELALDAKPITEAAKVETYKKDELKLKETTTTVEPKLEKKHKEHHRKHKLRNIKGDSNTTKVHKKKEDILLKTEVVQHRAGEDNKARQPSKRHHQVVKKRKRQEEGAPVSDDSSLAMNWEDGSHESSAHGAIATSKIGGGEHVLEVQSMSNGGGSMNIMEPVPGPYLEDKNGQNEEMDGIIKALRDERRGHQTEEFSNLGEYIKSQRTRLMVDPEQTEIFRTTGYLPIVQPEAHFRLIDRLFKEKNDRVKVFHNLYLFLKKKGKKFKIPQKPNAKAD